MKALTTRGMLMGIVLGLSLPLTVSAASVPVETQWFAGTSRVQLPDGRIVASNDDLIMRRVDQAAGQIVEAVWTRDKRGGPARHFEVVQTVAKDGTFTMAEQSNAFEGTGSLVGEPWHWDCWQSRSTLAGGDVVLSFDILTPTGMTVSKRFSQSDGKLKAFIFGEFAPISEAEFKSRTQAWAQ